MKHISTQHTGKRPGMIVLGLLAFVTAYLMATAAIDTARLVYYFGTIVFMVLGVRWLAIGIRGFRKGIKGS